jgi:alpha-glucosidase
VDVIKSIPAVWDQTVVLPDSEIGELAAYARRTGDTWFVAAMCGPQAKTLQVPLSFLGLGPYQRLSVRDGDSDASVTIERTTNERGDSLRVELRAGGGFVARFSRN